MKRLFLFGAVSTLTLLAIIGTANAVLVAGNNPSITAGETSALVPAATTPSLSEDVSIFGASGGSLQIPPDNNTNNRNSGVFPSRANSHMDLWLLLLVAAVAGIVSEIFHHRSCN